MQPMLALTFLAATAPLSLAALDDARLTEIVSQRLHGDRTGACLAVAVVAENVSRAYVCADAEIAPRVGPDTAFEIGSISKTMTATLLADLIVQGEASLDDPLHDWLPEGTKVPDHNGQPILLRHVVTHSAGLPALPSRMHTASMLDPYAGLGEDDLLASLGDVTLDAPPGSAFAYSNFASMVLSLAVSRRSGTGFEDLLSQRLLQPLGMHGAFVASPPEGVRLAQGHMPNRQPTPAWTFQANLAGVGGVRATLDDMVRYAQAQLGQLDAPIMDAIDLSQQAIAGSPQPMAMNWLLAPLDDRSIHVHEGGTGGFSSFLAFDRQRARAVIVLSDTALTSTGGLGDLGMHLLDARRPLGQPRRAAQPPSELLDSLAGRYRLAGGLGMTLTRKGDTLYIQASGQPEFEMGYDSAGDFHPLLFDALLRPRRGATGWTFDWLQSGAHMPATRLDGESAAPAIDVAALQDYVGEYRLTEQFALRFFVEAGVLHAQGTGQPALPLDYADVDLFVMEAVGAEMHFERDAEGVVQAMRLKQRGAELRGVRE